MSPQFQLLYTVPAAGTWLNTNMGLPGLAAAASATILSNVSGLSNCWNTIIGMPRNVKEVVTGSDASRRRRTSANASSAYLTVSPRGTPFLKS